MPWQGFNPCAEFFEFRAIEPFGRGDRRPSGHAGHGRRFATLFTWRHTYVLTSHESGTISLNKGELHWVRAAHSRILQVLHNPRYAGAFVYGRVRTRRLPDDKHSTTKVPRTEWQFVIPGIHAGYITWEQFGTAGLAFVKHDGTSTAIRGQRAGRSSRVGYSIFVGPGTTTSPKPISICMDESVRALRVHSEWREDGYRYMPMAYRDCR
jgi:Recombinase